QPRIAADLRGRPFVAEPRADLIVCLACPEETVVIVPAYDPVANLFVSNYGAPSALAVDVDNGLLIAEKGTQKMQKLAPASEFPQNGNILSFSNSHQQVTDILNNRQLPLPNVTLFSPVGVARIPGLLLAADDYSRIIWSTTRPLIIGPCPSGG